MTFGLDCIRPATPADAAQIANVHVAAWKTTYRDILPDSVLDELSVEQRQAFWSGVLADLSRESIALVGCDATGQVQGFAIAGKERTGNLGCDGELFAIYLLETARGQGLGTTLVRQIATSLQSKGFGSLAVWVLALNPYRRFYEKLGGQIIGTQLIERGGQSFEEVAYGWQGLNQFAPVARFN